LDTFCKGAKIPRKPQVISLGHSRYRVPAMWFKQSDYLSHHVMAHHGDLAVF
jgi:hypothetical protein